MSSTQEGDNDRYIIGSASTYIISLPPYSTSVTKIN